MNKNNRSHLLESFTNIYLKVHNKKISRLNNKIKKLLKKKKRIIFKITLIN